VRRPAEPMVVPLYLFFWVEGAFHWFGPGALFAVAAENGLPADNRAVLIARALIGNDVGCGGGEQRLELQVGEPQGSAIGPVPKGGARARRANAARRVQASLWRAHAGGRPTTRFACCCRPGGNRRAATTTCCAMQPASYSISSADTAFHRHSV
jgi:hypothetical protein